MNMEQTYRTMKRDRLERELVSLNRVLDHCLETGALRHGQETKEQIELVERLLLPESWCHFDVTDETSGETSFCGDQATVDEVPWLEHPPLCRRHQYWLDGWYTGWTRHGHSEDQPTVETIKSLWNMVECFDSDHGRQLCLSTYVGGDKSDPSEVAVLACGHEVL